MPTEHEYKYVLSLDLLRELSELKLKDLCKNYAEIRQGYMTDCTRVRQIDGEWFFTYKQDVLLPEQLTHVLRHRVVEIETSLDERDGNDLWACCNRRIFKTRHYFPCPATEPHIFTWELDLFYPATFPVSENPVYFIMLEVELPEGSARPTNGLIPDFLRKHIVYEVALTDARFSNKRLGDVEYVKQLYQQIDQGVINASQDQNPGADCSKNV